jgi:hypothetical protein
MSESSALTVNGEHNDRHTGEPSKLPQRLQAVHPRHHDVEDHQFWHQLADLLERFLAVMCLEHFEPFQVQVHPN